MVREAAVAVMVEKYGINLTFLLLFVSFLLLLLIVLISYSEGYQTTNDQNESNRFHDTVK